MLTVHFTIIHCVVISFSVLVYNSFLFNVLFFFYCQMHQFIALCSFYYVSFYFSYLTSKFYNLFFLFIYYYLFFPWTVSFIAKKINKIMHKSSLWFNIYTQYLQRNASFHHTEIHKAVFFFHTNITSRPTDLQQLTIFSLSLTAAAPFYHPS